MVFLGILILILLAWGAYETKHEFWKCVFIAAGIILLFVTFFLP